MLEDTGRPIGVRVVCTDRAGHGRRQLARGFLYRGKMSWREGGLPAVEAWEGEPGFAGWRWRFPSCPTCGLHGVTLRQDTFAAQIEELAAATRHNKSVDIDLSLLG